MQRRSRMLIIALLFSAMATASAQTRRDADEAYNRGRELYTKGDFDRAINAFTRAIELSSSPDFRNNPRRQNWNAELDPAGDGSRSDVVTLIDPLTALAFANRALARAKKGDLEGGITDCDRAIAINPGLVLFYNNRGALRWATGDVSDTRSPGLRAALIAV